MKNFCEDLFFFFFFGEHLRFVSLVLGLGLEHSCLWPRECLSSERLSLALALASDFFCVLGLGLGLEPCILDSTSAVKASNQKLTITRKESEGDGGMDNMDLREIQNAITKMILCTDPGFLVHIERTFIFEGKVLIICKDEKTLEWAKHVLEAIVPSLVVHQGYDAKGPKDLPLAKTFGIWLPEDDGLSISDTLTLVSRCNAKITCTDLETKHSAKWNEGVLHLVSVQELSLTTLKELNYNPYAGYRRVQFQKKKSAKQFQNLETSSRSPKGDENL